MLQQNGGTPGRQTVCPVELEYRGEIANESGSVDVHYHLVLINAAAEQIHRPEAGIGFAGSNGDPFELFDCLEEILYQIPPFACRGRGGPDCRDFPVVVMPACPIA